MVPVLVSENSEVLIPYAIISLNIGIKCLVTAESMDELKNIEGNIHL